MYGLGASDDARNLAAKVDGGSAWSGAYPC